MLFGSAKAGPGLAEGKYTEKESDGCGLCLGLKPCCCVLPAHGARMVQLEDWPFMFQATTM